MEYISNIRVVKRDILAKVQDFLGEQLGYEVCRWQIVAVCILLGISILTGSIMYYRRARATKRTTAPTKIVKKRDEEKSKKKLLVYICGAVQKPGVYQLKPDARIVDALTMAGGFNNEADQQVVNLAKPINDGDQIYVPKMGEVSPAGYPYSETTLDQGMSDRSKIDLNSANTSELETLPGIGEKLAARIISYREEHGPFQTVEQLTKVEGIGPKKFEDIQPKVTI